MSRAQTTRWRTACMIGVILAALISTPAAAEIITLQNGDRLTGEIIDQNQLEITLRHSVLGTIKIPRSKLRSPVPAARENTRPADSNPSSLNTTTAKTPPTASQPPAGAAHDVTTASTKMAPKLLGFFNSYFQEGWKRRVAVGIKGEAGNDVSMDFSMGLDASYHDDYHRIVISSAYYYETEDQKKETSKGHINLIRDWLLPESKWFYYGYFRYEYDSFKSWKNRISLSGGTGYDFFKEKNLQLSGRVGLGGNRSWGTENAYELEGQLGMEWNWKPAMFKHQSISTEFIVYPALNKPGEYRTWMQGKWRIDFDFYRGLGFELGFEHEYESNSDKSIEDEKYYDLIYFGRLGLDF